MGTIYQRRDGGTYYGYWTDARGASHRRSLRTRDRRVADARLREFELAATNPAAYSRATLSQALEALLEVVAEENAAGTLRCYRQKAGHFVRLLGDVQIAAVDRDMVMRYIKIRRAETAAGGTIHKELVVLRRALAEAIARKWWAGDVRAIVPTIKVDYVPRETWLTEHQMEQLLRCLPPRRRLWVMLAAYGGLCRGEVERLRWEHVDFRAARMRVPGTKRRARWRLIPATDVLLAAMESCRRETGPVVERWGNVIRDLAIACEKARVPRVTPNDLRRTCASWLKNQGVDTSAVAAMLGNTPAMIERVYGRISIETLERAVARLPGGGACAAGEQNEVPSGDTNDTGAAARPARNRRIVEGKRVPRVGIEPTTRGFSVRAEPRVKGKLRAV